MTLPAALPRFSRRSSILLAAASAVGALLVAGGASAATTPTFAVSAAPSSLTNHNNAGEPSIGVDWKTGNVMYQAYTSTYKITPPSGGSASWSNVSSPASQFNLDPILYTDAPQGRT